MGFGSENGNMSDGDEEALYIKEEEEEEGGKC